MYWHTEAGILFLWWLHY